MSVIIVTSRLGGFDMLYHSLRHQCGVKPTDWELIIVDDWQELRADRIEADQVGCAQVKHLKPRTNDYYDPCYARNLGLRVAEGELIVSVDDMIWLYPEFLADHWRIYNEFPGYTLSGYLDRYPIPKLKTDLTPDTQTAWSVFDREFDYDFATAFFYSVEPLYRERKGGNLGVPIGPYFEIPGCFVYLNVDSVPARVFRDLGGIDETYDGGYGYCDIDFSCRANMVGHKFLVKQDAISYKLGVAGMSAALPGKNKPRLNTVDDNRQIFERRMAAIMEHREPINTPQGKGAWNSN